MTPRELILRSPVIPVLKIHQPADAGTLAQALVRGGLSVMEVTVRTPGAIEAIRVMRKSAPEAIIGAGDLADAHDLEAAAQAGAHFGVTPGVTAQFLADAGRQRLPLLPGIATPGELMAARAAGYEVFKLFPAQLGGLDLLSTLAEPFPTALFYVAGGISRHNAHEYLALGNVAAVAGAWIAPADAVAAQDWITIEALARDAATLRRHGS